MRRPPTYNGLILSYNFYKAFFTYYNRYFNSQKAQISSLIRVNPFTHQKFLSLPHLFNPVSLSGKAHRMKYAFIFPVARNDYSLKRFLLRDIRRLGTKKGCVSILSMEYFHRFFAHAALISCLFFLKFVFN